MKTDTLFVDAIEDEREKSWIVIKGATRAALAKSLCTRLSELEFEVPKWLCKKIEAAA